MKEYLTIYYYEDDTIPIICENFTKKDLCESIRFILRMGGTLYINNNMNNLIIKYYEEDSYPGYEETITKFDLYIWINIVRNYDRSDLGLIIL